MLDAKPFRATSAKAICLRLTQEQHADLATAAMREGVSLNTYILERLGLETPFEQYGEPRGRKPKIALRVNLGAK